MAFSTGRPRGTAMAEINVTPLVDVMLVLLIIFMVTAPMMQEGVNVKIPEVPGGAPIDQDQSRNDIIIAVDDKGAIYIDDAQVQEQALVEKIQAKVKENPKHDVYLRADKAVAYGTVVRIMAALRGAGITDLGMITSPKEETAPGK